MLPAADPGQLGETSRRIGVEHHPELAGRYIEFAGGERKILPVSFRVLDVTAVTTLHRKHSGIDVDPDHPGRRAATNRSGQGPRTARNVDNLVGALDLGRASDRLGEPPKERRDEQRVVDLGGVRADLPMILVRSSCRPLRAHPRELSRSAISSR